MKTSNHDEPLAQLLGQWEKPFLTGIKQEVRKVKQASRQILELCHRPINRRRAHQPGSTLKGDRGSDQLDQQLATTSKSRPLDESLEAFNALRKPENPDGHARKDSIRYEMPRAGVEPARPFRANGF